MKEWLKFFKNLSSSQQRFIERFPRLYAYNDEGIISSIFPDDEVRLELTYQAYAQNVSTRLFQTATDIGYLHLTLDTFLSTNLVPHISSLTVIRTIRLRSLRNDVYMSEGRAFRGDTSSALNSLSDGPSEERSMGGDASLHLHSLRLLVPEVLREEMPPPFSHQD